jgi:hypothetical protein
VQGEFDDLTDAELIESLEAESLSLRLAAAENSSVEQESGRDVKF